MGILLHKFAYFKGLRLFFLSNFPEAMFIQGATSIPDSRVPIKIRTNKDMQFMIALFGRQSRHSMAR